MRLKLSTIDVKNNENGCSAQTIGYLGFHIASSSYWVLLCLWSHEFYWIIWKFSQFVHDVCPCWGGGTPSVKCCPSMQYLDIYFGIIISLAYILRTLQLCTTRIQAFRWGGILIIIIWSTHIHNRIFILRILLKMKVGLEVIKIFFKIPIQIHPTTPSLTCHHHNIRLGLTKRCFQGRCLKNINTHHPGCALHDFWVLRLLSCMSSCCNVSPPKKQGPN